MLETFKSDLQVCEELTKILNNWHLRKAWRNAGFSSRQELLNYYHSIPNSYVSSKPISNTLPAYLAYYILKHKLNVYEARAYVKQSIKNAKKKYPTKTLKNWIRSEVDRYILLYTPDIYPLLYKHFK